MELIIKVYGKVLLEVAALILFLLLTITGIRDGNGNAGFFHMLGAFLEEEQTVYGSDFRNCVEESKRGISQIFYKKEGAVQIGSYDVAELFEAVDCDGNALPLQIRSVWNPHGIPENDVYRDDTTQLSFDESGIYTLQIGATDAWNRTSICKIHIPVNW